MTPLYADPLVTLYLGDCLEVMRELPDASVDSVVTDPPYGLSFMGKEWDALAKVPPHTGPQWGGYGWHGTGTAPPHLMQAWHEQWATEAFRVLKPGGYLLAFGGTRTYHRLASAIEDAGFEIRDTLMWIYASGFPKSLDVSKALDKVAGAEREVTGTRQVTRDFREVGRGSIEQHRIDKLAPGVASHGSSVNITAPATDLARKWQGWGTALKPAHEPIVMARKPLVGTVAANVTRFGTGAINVDGCRIGYQSEKERAEVNGRTGPNSRHREQRGTGSVSFSKLGERHVEDVTHPAGRWPSNVLLSDPELFDEPNPGVVGSGATTTSGMMKAGTLEGRASIARNPMPESPMTADTYGDSGGYSRFFLIPKSDRSERERGLDSLYCNCKTVKPERWGSEDRNQPAQTATTSRARAISAATSEDGFGWPTTPSGSDTSDPSPPATRSTTSTATSKTTGSPTSSPSIASPISDSTPGASSSTASGGSGARSAPPTDRSPTNGGTSAGKAGRSTADADPATSPASAPISVCESCGKPRHSTAVGGADGVTRAARRNSHPT